MTSTAAHALKSFQIFRSLPVHCESCAAVQLPALLIRFRAERFFLAIADHADAILCHARADQRGLCRVSAVLAQRQVVLVRTPLVAVSRQALP